MLSQINEKLWRAKERVQARRALEAVLAQAQHQLHEQQQRCLKHKQLLGIERARVEKLKGLSLTSLLFTILGTKSDRLDKLNQEQLVTQLQHAQSVEAVEFAEAEFDRLDQRLNEFRDADSEYVRLVDEKHRILVELGDHRAEALDGLVKRHMELGADGLELQKAMLAGTAALESLERVRVELRSAEDVCPEDELGDAFKATKEKLSRIDTASKHAQAAQRRLCKFQEELADASLRIHMAVHIDEFSSFAHTFFEGLIADWIVKSNIRAASVVCGNTSAAVIATLAECRRQLAEVEKKTEAVKEQLRQSIEQA